MKQTLLSVYILAVVLANTRAGATIDDAYVLTISDEDSSEITEFTTAEPSIPIKMTEMVVKSKVSLRYAHTAVVTRVLNPARRAQQTIFHVLLPETAFISGFVMTLNGKPYIAYVKEKEIAKKIYKNAVAQGMAAAHISARARDSNHFTVSVNVEPKTEAVFNLTYEELLVRRNGVYNHDINLHPGAIVPKMEITVHINESQKISVLRVPEMKTGNEIDSNENDVQYDNPASLKVHKSSDEREAIVTFAPDSAEQLRLMRTYADKTRESAILASRRNDESASGILGQFVVQYDVERPENGEILVNDGYFVHFYAPPSLKPLSKHVVFVLDTSGSMGGRKIDQLRTAMRSILDDMQPTDYFNIVEFNSIVKVHKTSEQMEKQLLATPSVASQENIAKAKVAISRLSARGGTNIYRALDVAVDIMNAKYETDKTSSTSAASKAEEGVNKDALKPVIIFLTDGEPTVGETNQENIISYISKKNSGEKKAAIYTLAFGQEADRNLLRKLSGRNDGFMRQIYEAADADLQLRNFYQQVSSPLLSDAKFAYPPEQVKEGTVTKHKFGTVFMGSELVVAGEVAPETLILEPSMDAYAADELNRGWKKYEVKNKIQVSKKKDFLPLERLWAYLTIKQLLDGREIKTNVTEYDPSSPEGRALGIALKYEFVTPLTSLVVVKPNATDDVSGEVTDDGHIKRIPNTLILPRVVSRNKGLSSFQVSGFHSGHASTTVPAALLSNRGYFLEDKISTNNIIEPGQELSVRYGVDVNSESHSPIASSQKQPLEDPYHLHGYGWALTLLDNDTDMLEFSDNGKNVTLKLSKSPYPPREYEDSKCRRVAGEPSLCVYITRCAAAKDINIETYLETYCIINNEYAGVCCPRRTVDIHDTWIRP